MAKKKRKQRSMADMVPSNWCDSLLTGPDAALPKGYTFNCKDIERLLNGIRDRIRATEKRKER